MDNVNLNDLSDIMSGKDGKIDTDKLSELTGLDNVEELEKTLEDV